MFKDYCEVQFELGNHAKAMAFAPAVSIDYWQELAERRAELSLKEESEDAAYNCIIANKLADATQIFEDREEYEDAKLVRSL